MRFLLVLNLNDFSVMGCSFSGTVSKDNFLYSVEETEYGQFPFFSEHLFITY